MKKLLFVINTLGRAGAEMALIELLRRLSLDGEYDVSLFVLLPQGELFENIPEGVTLLNKKHSSESVLSKKGRLRIAWLVFKAFWHRLAGFRLIGYFFRNLKDQKKTGRFQPDKLLWRLISEGTPELKQQFDLAVAYIEGASTYYVADHVKAAKKAAFVHIDYERAGYTAVQDQGCYDRIDRIFGVSKEVERKFLLTYPQYEDKVMLFYNLLDVNGIREKAQKGEGFTDGYTGTRLVTVGRLHYQKGYDIAINALKILRDKGRDIRWYVLGDGPEKASLQKQIDDCGLSDSFILMGAKPCTYPYVKQADIYVHATRFEGKSIAVEEAQILGKVIVASDCTGNTEQIIPEYDGILLSLSAENLAAQIERVLDDAELREKLKQNVLKKDLDHNGDLKKLLSLVEVSDN